MCLENKSKMKQSTTNFCENCYDQEKGFKMEYCTTGITPEQILYEHKKEVKNPLESLSKSKHFRLSKI